MKKKGTIILIIITCYLLPVAADLTSNWIEEYIEAHRSPLELTRENKTHQGKQNYVLPVPPLKE